MFPLPPPPPSFPYGQLLATLAGKPRVFVSFHHENDRAYYDAFSRVFHDNYEAVYDNSVDREVRSDDCEYVMRCIREHFIAGSSCTVVLCGLETSRRKFVDWEIKATLDKDHGLIGIALPSLGATPEPLRLAPHRLLYNIASGYASWITWSHLIDGGVAGLRSLIADAKAKPLILKENRLSLQSRNL